MGKISYKTIMLNNTLKDYLAGKRPLLCDCGGFEKDHHPTCPISTGHM